MDDSAAIQFSDEFYTSIKDGDDVFQPLISSTKKKQWSSYAGSGGEGDGDGDGGEAEAAASPLVGRSWPRRTWSVPDLSLLKKVM